MVLDAAGHRWTDVVGVDVGRFWEPEFGPSWYFVKLGALKTQVQHFVGENVAWEKVTTN